MSGDNASGRLGIPPGALIFWLLVSLFAFVPFFMGEITGWTDKSLTLA
ncbi:MAG: hypothetical protein GY696_13795 [Gammaproteobacteria bacterium]|nr:hypothetical protein [Gammaproteobacteria bacterium]